MPPKSEKNKSNPEKHAELNENWAVNLPLKYDDHACIDRDEIVYFAQQCASHLRNDDVKDLDRDFDQIFDMFCVMAVNALKTKNDVNNAVHAGKGKQHAKGNATMGSSDLRHALATHFDDAVANLSKVEEFYTMFYSHFDGKKLPAEWDDWLKDVKEEEPPKSAYASLDAFIAKMYPDKSAFQLVDKQKVYFGHRVFEIGKAATSEIINIFNPLWKVNKIPSGKNVSDMCRAIKVQRARARCHKNAYHSMRRQKEHLSGEWFDAEKLDFVRKTVQGKMKGFDPETMSPSYWFAFLTCSLPVNHFSKRKLALISCVPPDQAQDDNPAILPSSALRNLEVNGGGGGGSGVGGSSSGGNSKRKSGDHASSTGDSSASSFSHTVQLVSQNEEDLEIAHLSAQVSSIREAIDTLKTIDPDLYRLQIQNLQTDLANAVLHKVQIMQLRTQQYSDRRVQDATADVVARQIVDLAKARVRASSTPLSAISSPSFDPESTQLFHVEPLSSTRISGQRRSSTSSSSIPFHTKLVYESAESLDQIMHRQYGYVNMERESWEGNQPTREVLGKLRSYLELRDIDEDGRFMLTKWIKLVANNLGVPWAECGVEDGPLLKRSRLNQDDNGAEYVEDSYAE